MDYFVLIVSGYKMYSYLTSLKKKIAHILLNNMIEELIQIAKFISSRISHREEKTCSKGQ